MLVEDLIQLLLICDIHLVVFGPLTADQLNAVYDFG